MNYKIENVEEFVLSNGLRVLIKQDKSAPVFTCQLWFKVGAIDEPYGLYGSAHLIEHMLFRSGKNFKGGEISQLLRSYGGVDNAATSYDYTYYWCVLGPDYLDFAIKIMAERFYPLFDKDELKKEVGVVLSELEGYESRPVTGLSQALFNASFERSPYKRPIIGYREDLENIDRDELYDFYKKYYIPNNATLVLCGDVDLEEAKVCINKYFSPVPKGKNPKRIYPAEPEQKSFKTICYDTVGDTNMSFFAFHIPNIHHKDLDALTLLGGILCDGKNSRLYKSLVATGKAVNVYATPLSRKLESIFILDVTVNPSYSKECISGEIIEEIEKIKKEPITEEELKIALNQMKADIVYETDSVTGMGNALGIAEVYGNWRDYNKQIPCLEKVTVNDINRVLKKYFVENNTTLVETYIVKKEKFVKVPKGIPTKYKEKPVHINLWKEKSNIKEEIVKCVPKKYVLSNGIRLIVSENHSSGTVAVEGFVAHGDMYEPVNRPGIGDMCARMMKSGTKTRDFMEIAKSLDSVGSYIDFDISCERFSFAGKALSEYTDNLMFDLSDCLVNSVFPEKMTVQMRDSFVAEMMYNSQVPAKCSSNIFFNKAFKPGIPFYLATTDETINYISSVTPEDIKAFYNGLRPEDTIISVVGDINSEEIYEKCEKYFGTFEKGKNIEKVKESIYDLPKDMEIIDVPMNKSECAVFYGYPVNMKRSHEDFYKMKVANHILGGGGALNSRLGTEIREKRGLVYDIRSNVTGGHYNGYFRVVLGTNRKYVNEALTEIENLMKDFCDNGVSEKEVNDTRNFILGIYAKELETNEGMASALLIMEEYNLGFDYMYTIKDKYENITCDDVKDMAQKYIHPGKGLTVIVG